MAVEGSSEPSEWITADVQLPRLLLNAHAEGRVVFFVGAGASVAPPSSLPLFRELATALGDEAGVPYVEPEAFDHFLGRLTHLTPPYDVHRRTHALLTPPGSEPNATHAAIVELAAAHGRPRIVTTNFDNHLEGAARALRTAFADKWIGPALPPGDSFEGLVYLHGSISRGYRQLVLTDRDLGHAYLADAWATRFLLKLFQDNVVVFLGYGLTDPTLRYLTLGLPSGASLYAFVHSALADDSEWIRLGVRAVSFGTDYDNLRDALVAWNTRARMGRDDHRSRVGEIVAAGTTLTPVDRDYLSARLDSHAGVLDFVDATTALSARLKLEWLRWLENLPGFKSLFMAAPVPESVIPLTGWFARNFIASSALNGAALQTVQRVGQSMTTVLFEAALRATEDLAAEDSAAADRWRVVLLTSLAGQSAPLEGQLILPNNRNGFTYGPGVLRTILQPQLRLERRWYGDEAVQSAAVPNVKVTWRFDESVLTRQLTLAVEGCEPGDLSMGVLLEQALLGAYDLLRAFHGERMWDALSHGRSAIEPHAQDQFREPVDAVIDGLRRYGERALPTNSNLPSRWWEFNHALFRRLALYLTAIDPSRSCDEKLDWLLQRSDLYPLATKHELYGLLRIAIAEASPSIKQRVLAATEVRPSRYGPTAEDDRHWSYARYNLLGWLTGTDPNWRAAAEALGAIQAQHGTFVAREHPDFDSWVSSGSWGGRLPMTTEEFAHALSVDARRAVDRLLERDYSERNFDEPTWRDTLDLVRQTCAADATSGLTMWDALLTRGQADERGLEMRRAAVHGWGDAKLGDLTLEVSKCVASLAADTDSAHDVGWFLLRQVRAHINSDETPFIRDMRQIALAVWQAHASGFTHESDFDPMSSAPLYLNSWPGFVAQYWLFEMDRRWRCNRDNWEGLSDTERGALNGLLAGPPAALSATVPALASELFFLFAADESFCTAKVLPLFKHDATARLAWHAYLERPRYNDRLLAAGLTDATVAQWGRIAGLVDGHVQRRFLDLVASIVSFAGIAAEARADLLRASVVTDGGAYAANFADTMVSFVRMEGVDGAQLWDTWLGEHLRARLSGVPRTAANEELARWADTVPALGHRIPVAASLFVDYPLGLAEGYVDPEFPDGSLAAYADELVTLYTRRVSYTRPLTYRLAERVRIIVEAVRMAVGPAGAEPLVSAARERGFPE
ncbi:SIR2 family protein [Nakamurella endophytica]|uniref:SIR2-like domain-containing protein n=1 Tax=Nakamurella endophytica TaxID=1748367 RepID=A0A917SVP0_9ACTN|nr:SIR2 family protein [Nakamurella endophytica]GGL98368.1 hypothetical protein GCM10011594_17830 [Nakamurella endophytica]